MKILVIGHDPRKHSLLGGLLASPLWSVTHCASTEEAVGELANATAPFDYVLLDVQESRQALECSLEAEALSRGPKTAKVVSLSREGTQLHSPRGDGVYGLYPIAGTTAADEGQSAQQWVFEYHAPCRKSSSR